MLDWYCRDFGASISGQTKAPPRDGRGVPLKGAAILGCFGGQFPVSQPSTRDVPEYFSQATKII